MGPVWALGSGHTLMLNGFALTWKDQICNLGVLLDLALLLRKQVAAAGRSTSTTSIWFGSYTPWK